LQQVSYAYIGAKQFDRAAALIQQSIALSQTSTPHPEVLSDFNPTFDSLEQPSNERIAIRNLGMIDHSDDSNGR
jgi:hypothetical protein